jgi:hypothetical protein
MIQSATPNESSSNVLDERGAVRHQIRLTRTATTTLHGDFVVTVLNISTTGALLETPLKLRPGTPVTITIDGAMNFVGWVTWCGHGFAGLEFANPLLKAVVDYIVAISAHCH